MTREFAQLSHSFLGMAEQLARRSDYIATFSAHRTHELKSPLTSIKGWKRWRSGCASSLAPKACHRTSARSWRP